MTLPSLFLAGAEKAGTTTLHALLAEHPDILWTPHKEPHVFSWKWRKWAREGADPEDALQAWYATAYDGTAAWHGDASTSTLWDLEAQDRIARICPEARFLVLLRDPVERAYSHHLMRWRDGDDARCFEDAVDAELAAGPGSDPLHRLVWSGCYDEQLRHLIALFGLDRVHVVPTARLAKDPQGVVTDILRFLDLDPTWTPVDPATRRHTHKVPRGRFAHWLRTGAAPRRVARILFPLAVRRYVGDRLLQRPGSKPAMDPEVRTRLEAYYAPRVATLERILGRSLPELTEKWTEAGRLAYKDAAIEEE